jgi:CheY-like chemotaxis protein
MRILVVDDEPELMEPSIELLRVALEAEVQVVSSVDEAVQALHDTPPTDVVIADIFLPLGERPRELLGPRARRYAENLVHLGGLVLLDEIDRVEPAPKVLAYTACTDFALLEVLGDRVTARIPKPCPADVLLQAVMDAVRAS